MRPSSTLSPETAKLWTEGEGGPSVEHIRFLNVAYLHQRSYGYYIIDGKVEADPAGLCVGAEGIATENDSESVFTVNEM
jgi:hypothetical protein